MLVPCIQPAHVVHLTHFLPLCVCVCVTAVEFLDSYCMDLVENHLHLSNPISSAPFYTLVETSGSNDEHDKEV